MLNLQDKISIKYPNETFRSHTAIKASSFIEGLVAVSALSLSITNIFIHYMYNSNIKILFDRSHTKPIMLNINDPKLLDKLFEHIIKQIDILYLEKEKKSVVPLKKLHLKQSTIEYKLKLNNNNYKTKILNKWED